MTSKLTIPIMKILIIADIQENNDFIDYIKTIKPASLLSVLHNKASPECDSGLALVIYLSSVYFAGYKGTGSAKTGLSILRLI